MCNHDIDRGHCVGDSGGPLFIKIGYHYLQIGVASFGVPSQCGRFQGGFARLTPNVLMWIRKMMRDEDPEDEVPLEYKKISLMPEPGCGKMIIDPQIPHLQYPWLVDVCVDYEEDRTDLSGNKITCSEMCKGTLITKRYVLTSASCVKRSDENNTVVFFGSKDIQDSLSSLDYKFLAKNEEIKTQGGLIGVGKWNTPIKIHPDYSPVGTEEYMHTPDVALLKLETFLDFDLSINHICLPPLNKFGPEYDYFNQKTIIGTKNGFYSGEKEVTVKSKEWCQSRLNFMQR